VARLLGALQACATCTGSDTNGWEWDDGLEINAIGLGTGQLTYGVVFLVGLPNLLE